MSDELSRDLTWSLRALAQDAPTQRSLYPWFVVVADELVSDFELAYTKSSEEFRRKNPDLEVLDAHILSKSGVAEYWTDDALENTEFWEEIRRLARAALLSRDLSTFAPHPSQNTFVSEHEMYVAGRPVDRENRQPRLLTRIRKLFR